MNVSKSSLNKSRIILHIDMNAFFCSAHEANEPDKYKDKSIAVAGSSELRQGIIVTSSYVARSKGIKTGMVVGQAKKLDPDLIIIEPDFNLYHHYSKEFMKIVNKFSPIVEVASIDECFVDITGSRQFGEPIEIAKKIQTTIMEELSLPCSIGIGPNKLLAKMASDMKKPLGISILRTKDFPNFFWDKPTYELFGIGKKLAQRLEKRGIYTIGQLANTSEEKLIKEFGILGTNLVQSANGIDESPIVTEMGANKSIGHTTTLPKDILSVNEAFHVFLNLADQVVRRLRKQGMLTNTIQIVIRYSDLKTITRSLTIKDPTEEVEVIYKVSCGLFNKYWNKKPVRLLGITLQNLNQKKETGRQLNIFIYEDQPKKEQLNETIDSIRDKYGEQALINAGLLDKLPDRKIKGTSFQKDYLKNEKKSNL